MRKQGKKTVVGRPLEGKVGGDCKEGKNKMKKGSKG